MPDPLKSQHTRAWKFRSPFCRTIFTTNFDSLLQHALQQAHELYYLSDDPALFGFLKDDEETGVHLVHTHGSVHRQFQAHSELEFHQSYGTKKENLAAIQRYFEQRGVIVMGYSGWQDVCMDALDQAERFEHGLFWCGRDPGWIAVKKLSDRVAALLTRNGNSAYYVQIPEGADAAMRRLHSALGLGALPDFVVEPLLFSIEQLKGLKLPVTVGPQHVSEHDSVGTVDLLWNTRRQLEDLQKF